MDLSDVVKKQIMETFIESIDVIADTEFQKRVWVKGQGPECHSYDDFTSYFFDESKGILNEYKKFGITNEQFLVLTKFHNELNLFYTKNSHEPRDFLSSPEWKRITKTAKGVLKALNCHK